MLNEKNNVKTPKKKNDGKKTINDAISLNTKDSVFIELTDENGNQKEIRRNY